MNPTSLPSGLQLERNYPARLGVSPEIYPRAMSRVTLPDKLERVARRHVETSIPSDPSGELAAMELSKLLIVYGNWRGRFVSRRPRKVHISRELLAELPGSEHETAVENVCAEIKAGADLTPRLSKDAEVAYLPRGERKTGGGLDPDIDVLLAHDGLHHLHLGGDAGGAVVPRTRDLLFVAFRDDDAYTLGVCPHGSWGRRDLLERIVRNEVVPFAVEVRGGGPVISERARA